MGSLNGRVTKLESAVGDSVKDHGWHAYGLLLDHGYDMMRHAGQLYEAGRLEELRRLWVDLASETPHRLQPEPAHLDWALRQMPSFLREWKQEPWWDALATYEQLIADVDAGLIVVDPSDPWRFRHTGDEQDQKRLSWALWQADRTRPKIQTAERLREWLVARRRVADVDDSA